MSLLRCSKSCICTLGSNPHNRSLACMFCFPKYRSCDNYSRELFLQISSYLLAYERIIHEETKLVPLQRRQNTQDKELYPSAVYRETWIKNHDAAIFYFCLLVFTCLLGHTWAYPQDLIMKEYCRYLNNPTAPSLRICNCAILLV